LGQSVREGDGDAALGPSGESNEENPMQDLIQNYVDDLNKLRDAFHIELTATSEELSKAMGLYAHRSEAALASFMEKASALGLELEAAAAARLNQFRGLPADDAVPDIDDRPLPDPSTNADRVRVAAVAERAVAEGLLGDSDADRKPQPITRLRLLNQGQPPESVSDDAEGGEPPRRQPGG
jgi:hypothetical protein